MVAFVGRALQQKVFSEEPHVGGRAGACKSYSPQVVDAGGSDVGPGAMLYLLKEKLGSVVIQALDASVAARTTAITLSTQRQEQRHQHMRHMRHSKAAISMLGHF